MHSTYVIGIYLNYTLIEIRGKLCRLGHDGTRVPQQAARHLVDPTPSAHNAFGVGRITVREE